MALIPAPKEVLEMGRVLHDPETGEPIFPHNATKEQIAAYREWHKKIEQADNKRVMIEK